MRDSVEDAATRPEKAGGTRSAEVTKGRLSTNALVKIAVLGVIAFVLMFLDSPVWFAPAFLKLDISGVPALLGSFAMGPATGVWVEFIKNILNFAMEGSTTNGIGELTNFLIGSVFAYTCGCVYQKKKTFRNAVLSLIIGVLVMAAFATLNNYFVMFPLYAKVFGVEVQNLIDMASKVNGFVVDYKTLMLYAVLPFNLLKGTVVSIITMLVYKKVSPILHR